MSNNRFIVETVEITDCDTDESRITEVITDMAQTYSYETLEEVVHLLNEMDQRIRKAESYLKIFNPLVYQAYLESFKED